MSAPTISPPGKKVGPGTAAKPFSLRFTNEERRLLASQAGGTQLATYLRDLILERSSQAFRRRTTSPVKDHEALARVLAGFGQSRIANNLNQLAKALNIGA